MNHTFSTFAAAMLISILFITSCNSAQEQQRATLIKSSDNRELPLPSRDPEAIVGSEFIKSLGKVTFEQGPQDEIVSQILSGNIPDILRKFRTIRYFQKDADSVMHKVEIEILTDYLAIGSNEDFIRMPMGPIAAQKLADSLRCTLPTTFLVDKIAEASEGGIEPFPFWPYGIRNSYPGTYDDSNRAINALYRANGYHAGQLISGLKKDIVISSETYKDSSRLDRLAIYGWHYPDGRHIQDLHYKHGDFYVDYSHGVRLIYRICLVDGVEHDIEDLLKDEVMYRVVSLEPITQYTYRR